MLVCVRMVLAKLFASPTAVVGAPRRRSDYHRLGRHSTKLFVLTTLSWLVVRVMDGRELMSNSLLLPCQSQVESNKFLAQRYPVCGLA
jgi:hypothetical protein